MSDNSLMLIVKPFNPFIKTLKNMVWSSNINDTFTLWVWSLPKIGQNTKCAQNPMNASCSVAQGNPFTKIQGKGQQKTSLLWLWETKKLQYINNILKPWEKNWTDTPVPKSQNETTCAWHVIYVMLSGLISFVHRSHPFEEENNFDIWGGRWTTVQERCNTPLEHTPGNPPSQLWKESLYGLLVKV